MWSGLDELGASQNILAHQFERPISKMVGIVIETVNFRVGNRLFKCFITRFRFCSVKAKVSKTRHQKLHFRKLFWKFSRYKKIEKVVSLFFDEISPKIHYNPIILLSFRVILDLRRLHHAILIFA